MGGFMFTGTLKLDGIEIDLSRVVSHDCQINHETRSQPLGGESVIVDSDYTVRLHFHSGFFEFSGDTAKDFVNKHIKRSKEQSK